MKYGYIDKINSAKEFHRYILLFEKSGVFLDNIIVNINFEDFIASLSDGDTAIVCSYVGLFTSVNSYVANAIELIGRGIIIESLLEPNVSINNSNIEFARELNVLINRLHPISSINGVHKLKPGNRRVGRPRGSSSDLQRKVMQVEKLRQQSNISVVRACELTGCNLQTYYRIKEECKSKIK